MFKRLFFCFLFLLSAAAYSQKITISNSVKGLGYNSLLKKQFSKSINLSIQENDIFKDSVGPLSVMFENKLGNVLLSINSAQRAKLRAYIEKYKKWNKKADKKGVTLQKEIGTFVSDISAFSIGKKWYFQRSPLLVSVNFFSQKKGVHQLALMTSKITSSSNEYVSDSPDVLYFDWKNVSILENTISEKNLIKTANKKLKKKKDIESDFN
jgi:hypothetical protein